ncbi:MAG: response regulator [Hyphomonas sp.]|nr:response regulator [Hyphomonas sp.]
MNNDIASKLKLLSEQLRREQIAREAAEETLERVSLELTRSNKKLTEAARKHKALVQAIDEFEGSVIVIDQDEMCTYASEKTNAILGLSPDVILNRPLDRLSESLLHDQLCIAKKNGLHSTGHWVSKPVALGDRKNLLEFRFFAKEGRGSVIVIADVTKSVSQKLAFRAIREELKLLDRILQHKLEGETLSHNINTSIASITAMAETVDRTSTSEMIDGLEQIKALGYQIARDMRDYELELTKNEQPEIVKLNEFVEELSNEAALLSEPAISLTLSGFDQPLQTRFDKKVAKYAVYSAFRLLGRSNKSKHKLCIDVSGRENNQSVELEINVGFSISPGKSGFPALKSKELEQVSRLPSLAGFTLNSAHLTGNGMRLTISKPSAKFSEQVVQTSGDSVSHTADQLHHHYKPDVIVVEDDELMIELISEFVKLADYEPIAFQNPEKALAYISNNIDRNYIIVSDYLMPEMRGDELASKIKKVKPSVPIILYSAQATYKISEQDRYFDILKKPVSPQKLKSVLNAAELSMRCQVQGNLA